MNQPASTDERFWGKWLLRIGVVLVALVVLLFAIGSFVPATFRSSAAVIVPGVTVAEVWAVVDDPKRVHLSSDPSCVVLPLPDVDGLPAWQEKIRGATIDVHVVERMPEKRVVWNLAAVSGPLSTRWTLSMQTTSSGSIMVSIDESGQVAGGSWQSPFYRFMMFAVGGWGPDDYLKRVHQDLTTP